MGNVAATREQFVQNAIAGVDLGDRRLVKRLETILRAASSAPSSSFPEMCATDAELEGTYRFLNNEKVSPDAILAPHIAATVHRIAQCQRVIVSHDTTEFAYGPVPRGDLGLVGRGTTYGFGAHVAIAVAADAVRTPLGALALSLHNRPFGKKRARTAANKDAPENAMLRWKRTVQRVREQVGTATNIIHVMDREADDYTLLAELSEEGERFVIRQAVDRRLIKHLAEPKVRSLLAGAPLIVERTVEISARRKPTKKKHATRQPLRKARKVVLEVRAQPVSIPKTPSARTGSPGLLTLNLVQAVEANPPEGEERIEWWLWTNEPVDSAEDVLAVLDAYTARWAIEEFFKALKSGCRLEERQLESKHALSNALAIFVPIAWRLLVLRSAARVAPDAEATVALTPLQIRGLRGYMKLKRKVDLPERLTVRDAMLAVAAMGGHIKNNGAPGWIVLGRGFDRLLDVELGLSLALKM